MLLPKVSRSVCLGVKPHLGHKIRFFFYCKTVADLLMWGALSNKRTGLSFTIADLRQRSHSQVGVPQDSWPHFTVSDSRVLQPGGPDPCIYIPQEQSGHLYIRALISLFFRFLRLKTSESESELLYDWRFNATQFVLAQSSLRVTIGDFLQLNPCGHSPYVNILSDGKMGLSLMNMPGPSSSVRIAHITCSWKFFLVNYIQVLCQSKFAKQIMSLLGILCYNGSLVTWTVVSLLFRKIPDDGQSPKAQYLCELYTIVRTL
jgi:hypothetical protein